jgi:hypothetical protein
MVYFFSGSPQAIHLYKIIYGKGEKDALVTGHLVFSTEQILLFFLAFTEFLLIDISLYPHHSDLSVNSPYAMKDYKSKRLN